MIAVKIHAGLGNQMFQYAFAVSLAQRLNTTLMVDSHYADHYPTSREIPPQRYHLHHLGIEPDIPSKQLPWSFTKLMPDRLRKRWCRRHKESTLRRYGLHLVSDDLSWTLDRYQAVPDGSYLDGYFQIWPMIAPVLPELIQRFRVSIPTPNTDLLVELQRHESVAVNLRLGDYLHPRNSRRQGVLSPDYYLRAIDRMRQERAHLRFFVFSDDIAMAMAWLSPLKLPLHYVDLRPSKTLLSDMYYMMHCRHIIVANSSYSWWSAMLNRHEDKMVIAPWQWVIHREWQPANQLIVPTSWIRL